MIRNFVKVNLFLIFIGCLAGGFALRAKAAIPAEISSEFIVTADETVGNNIVIRSGGMLNINAGVTVTFQESGGPYKILVEYGGVLQLNGTAAGTMVRLISDLGTEFSGWQGIENYGTVTANYTEIRSAANGIYNNLTGICTVMNSGFYDCNVAVRVNQTTQGFKIYASVFQANGHAFLLQAAAAPLTAITQVYGNSFISNTHNFYLEGDNNLVIRGNDFTAVDGNYIFEFGQTNQTSSNEHVYISNNNFHFIRSAPNLESYYIVKINLGTPVGLYDCYWEYNGSPLTTVGAVNQADVNLPESGVSVYNPRSTPVVAGADTQAPTLIELSPGRSVPGTVNLTVVLEDDGWGVDPATVAIRVGGNLAVLQNSTSFTYNTRQYIFYATVNLATAGEYDWSVSAADLAPVPNQMTNQNLNGQKLVIVNESIPQVTPPSTWNSGGLTEGDYHLVTMPVTPSEKDHKQALGLDAPGSTIVRWQNGSYVYYGDSGLEQFAPGKGFWVRVGLGENFSAKPVPGTTQTANLTLPLAPGWHLIGDPFHGGVNETLNFNRLTFNYDGGSYHRQQHTFIEAVSEEYVGFGLWGHTATGYQFERESMDAWQGYWIYVKKPVELEFHNAEVNLFVAQVVISWEAQLTASQNGSSDSANYFGLAAMAASGVDKYDARKPPLIGGTLKSYFSPKDSGQEYGADYRPANTTRETWEYTITGLTPGEARINWGNLSQVPSNYQVRLRDLKSGNEVDLRRNSAYLFTVSGETERKFELVVAAQNMQSLQLANLRLNRNPFAPLRESMTLSYDLNVNATVDVKIYDWVGNLVYVRPHSSELAGSGLQIGWNGRNNLGKMVANGIYFCKITARSGSSESAQIVKVAVVN
jgi:hypothetical protein